MTLFTDQGFDATTVDEVARAAGVSKRSFFRYFASKSDLMAQGIVTYGTMITDAIKGCQRGTTPLEVMRQTVERVAVEAATQPRVRKIARIAATSTAAREAQLSRLADLEDRVADAYRQRTGAGKDSGGSTARRVDALGPGRHIQGVAQAGRPGHPLDGRECLRDAAGADWSGGKPAPRNRCAPLAC